MSRRSPFPHLSLLLLALTLTCACATSSPGDAAPDSASATSEERPDITPEKIREHVVGERVRDVPEENNAAESIDWRFDDDEPKEFNVIEKQTDGDKATVVIDMTTRSAPGARNQRRLAGRLRLHYELQTGWVMRKWEIVEIENISMKYRDEQKKQPQTDTAN